MIPLPVITFLLSTCISAFFKYMSERAQAREQAHTHLMDVATKTESSQQYRLTIEDNGFKFTRRFLAISAWSVYWGAKLALLFGLASLPIVYGEPQIVHHGFWIFGWTEEVMTFVPVHGVPFTSFDYHMLSAIVGSYFGNPTRT